MAEKKTNDETNETEVAEEAAGVEAAGEAETTEATPEPAEATTEPEPGEAEGPPTEEPAEVVAEGADDEEPAAEETQPEPDAAAEEAEPETVAEADKAVEAEPAAEDDEAGVSPPAGGDTPDVQAIEPKRKKKRVPRSLRPARPKRTRAAGGERKPIVRLPKPEAERGRRQERQGAVVSDAMEKTIVVEVQMVKAHPRYKKVVRRSVKFHAHDELNQAKVGDIVRIVETRPLSATKRWRLAEIIEAAK